MIDAISKLVESGAISEDVQKSIQEAWDSKIKENRETVGAELREEFAKRYEHDKSNMIEAIDKMMTEKLSEEITKFVEDRKALAQEKIAYKENVGKHSGKLEEFILSKLSEELKELAKMKRRGMTRKRVVDGTNWNAGHRIALQDNTTMDDDYYFSKGDESIIKRDTKKKVQAMIRRYKKQAFLHLENVSKGSF